MPVIGDVPRGEDMPTMREQRREVRMMLKAALVDMNVKMTSDRDYSSVGLQYTDRFTSYLEVLSAMSLLPWHQRVCIVCNLGPEKATQEDIAGRLGVSRQTVNDYIVSGLNEMCARIYETHPTNPTNPTKKLQNCAIMIA